MTINKHQINQQSNQQQNNQQNTPEERICKMNPDTGRCGFHGTGSAEECELSESGRCKKK